MIIDVNIQNKVAQCNTSGSYAVGDNNDIFVHFLFDAEWDEIEAKVAHFVWKSGSTTYEHKEPFVGDTVALPAVKDTSLLYIGVFSNNGEMHTSTPARLPVLRSTLDQMGEPEPPSDSEYQKIIALMEQAASDAATAKATSDTAKAIAEEARQTAVDSLPYAQRAEAAANKAEASEASARASQADAADKASEVSRQAQQVSADAVRAETAAGTASTDATRAETARARAETSASAAKASEGVVKADADRAETARDTAVAKAGEAEQSAVRAKASATSADQDAGSAEQALADLLRMLGSDVATLVNGKIPPSQIPSIATTEIYVVASQQAQNNIKAENGDICVRTDVKKSYIWKDTGWVYLEAPTDFVAKAAYAETAGQAENANMINNHRLVQIDAADFPSAVKDPDTFYLVYSKGAEA